MLNRPDNPLLAKTLENESTNEQNIERDKGLRT